MERYTLELIAWLPLIISIAGAFALLAHSLGKWDKTGSILRSLAVGMVIFRLGYAALLTALQWWMWSSDAIGKILLRQPISAAVPLPWGGLRAILSHPGGYFAFYVMGHYWFSVLSLFVIASLLALIVLLVRMLISKPVPDRTALLLFTASLIVGWPGVVVFVPVWFVIVLALSAYASIQKNSLVVSLSIAIATVLVVLAGPLLLPYLYTHILAF